MASYSMPLRTYIEKWSQDEELTTREKIERGRKHLFDFNYPIFDEAYRPVFETNFIRRFYMREIGFETEELFKFQLETWLLINMPYYNRMFETELLEYDVLTNSAMETIHKKMNDRDTNTDGSSKSSHNDKSNASGTSSIDDFVRDIRSDNPDSRLAITTQDGKGVIQYASNIDERKADNKANQTSNASSSANDESNTTLQTKDNEVEHFIQKRVGKVGYQSYPKMVMEYRDSLLRIENTMHNELNKLFMLVY